MRYLRKLKQITLTALHFPSKKKNPFYRYTHETKQNNLEPKSRQYSMWVEVININNVCVKVCHFISPAAGNINDCPILSAKVKLTGHTTSHSKYTREK